MKKIYVIILILLTIIFKDEEEISESIQYDDTFENPSKVKLIFIV